MTTTTTTTLTCPTTVQGVVQSEWLDGCSLLSIVPFRLELLCGIGRELLDQSMGENL